MSPDEQIVLREIVRPPEDGWRHHKCPLCERRGLSADKRGALSVSSRGYYKCHRCDSRGWLGERPHDADRVELEVQRPKMKLPEGCYELNPKATWTNRTLKAAADYLLGRGLTWETITRAKIHACVSGYYASRVIVPIMDGYNSPILGFVARSWESEAAVPYLYPKGMQRAELLYASTTSYQLHKEAPIVLVEGVFDALAVFPNGVAVLGKPSQWQVNKLIAENIPVAVCLDGDALDEGWSLALVLRVHGVRAGAIWLPPAKDPDEFPRDVIMKAARQCIDAPEPVRIEWP